MRFLSCISGIRAWGGGLLLIFAVGEVCLPSSSLLSALPIASLFLPFLFFVHYFPSLLLLRERGNFGQGPGVYLGYLNFFKGRSNSVLTLGLEVYFCYPPLSYVCFTVLYHLSGCLVSKIRVPGDFD